MKFFFTCSLMSFQKYTWIKERQLPNRAQFGGQNPLFCAVSPAGSSSLTCVHCHQFKTRCFHLSGTNAAFESPTDKKSQRIQAVLEAQDPVQHSLLNHQFFSDFYPKTPSVLWQHHTSEPGYFNPFFSLSRPDRPFKGQASQYNIYRIFMIIFILQ